MECMRATDIAARLINNVPAEESAEAFSRRVGLPYALTTEKLNNRRDIGAGLLYQICKAFGYQIMIYNPKPPKGLKSCYVVGKKHVPCQPREHKGKFRLTRDAYTNTVYRVPRKYKKKKRLIMVSSQEKV